MPFPVAFAAHIIALLFLKEENKHKPEQHLFTKAEAKAEIYRLCRLP